jgi:hypothetical protein
MRALILAAALAAAVPAFAVDRVARYGQDEVVVFDSPCVSAETLARINPEHRNRFRKAQGKIDGQRFFGCWMKVGEAVYVLWEDGDQGVIQPGELKPLLEL